MFDARTRGSALGPILAWSTLAQVVMVVTGYFVAPVAALFGPLGVTISLLAGVAVAALERPSWAAAAGRGALAGGVCALLGIAVSLALGDVTPLLLVLGTGSSTAAGALGGLVGRAVARTPRTDRGLPA